MGRNRRAIRDGSSGGGSDWRHEAGTDSPRRRAAVSGAFVWGFLAATSLIIGGWVGLRFRVGERALGLVMGFGAGVLISAVAYELVVEAVRESGRSGAAVLGLATGALAYFAGDLALDRWQSRHAAASTGASLPLVLGIVLDGVPESVVLGLTILEAGTVSVTFVVAVFLSNLPEAIAATRGLREGGWSGGRVMGLWVLMAVVSGAAAMLGYGALSAAGPHVLAFVQAFAAGAVLTMLANTMMPEAFRHGGRLVGLFTALGFVLSTALTLRG